MPELPEVETTARGLRPLLIEARISSVGGIDWPRMLPNCLPEDLVGALPGDAVSGVERRGKYLVLRLTSGGALVIHRKMSGNLLLVQAGQAPLRHTHLVVDFGDRGELHFVDPRKFGRIYYFSTAAQLDAFMNERLGPEPLELKPARLAAMFAGRRGRLKSMLLDQRFLAGVGNLYADESLWLARLNPARAVDSLSRVEVGRLSRAIVGVLTGAIERRGTSLSDYVDASGVPGENQHHLQVYGRAGQPCPRCGQAIERRLVGQRGTWFCPRCQPDRPRTRH